MFFGCVLLCGVCCCVLVCFSDIVCGPLLFLVCCVLRFLLPCVLLLVDCHLLLFFLCVVVVWCFCGVDVCVLVLGVSGVVVRLSLSCVVVVCC